jgi:nucleotide-binding universal stress UspA family protein
MTSPTIWKKPEAILLATDLSGRCDRALDRAAALARQWNVRLVVLTVMPPDRSIYDRLLDPPSWSQLRTPAQLAETRLRRSLSEIDADLSVTLRIETGETSETILRVAQEEGCGMIVTGIARNEIFQPIVLGSTVSWLVRHSPLPLLIVHNRPRRSYRQFVVACDFSTPSRHALEIASAYFDDPLSIALIHGFEVPRLGLMVMDASRDALIEQERDAARAQARQYLKEARIPDTVRERIKPVLEQGEPARLLREYVRDHESDLLVLSTYGRSALYGMLLGSVARQILESVQIDTLLVRDQRAA